MKENSEVTDINVGDIEEDIKILEELRIANENCIRNTKIEDTPFVDIWKKQNKALEHILSDYKRKLKENELLRKDIESWKKYCEEIEEEQIERSNKNCELEFEVEKLQKEQNEVNAKFIPVQIIEDFIKKYQKLSDEFYEKFLETNKTDKDLHDVGLACDAKVEVLQQLLEKGG